MPVFQYDALDAKGQEANGEIEALCDTEAVSKIRNKGLYPTRVRAKRVARKVAVVKPAMSGARRRGITGKVKLKRITQFARQMSTLQDAGLAILRSLRILERQQKKGTFKRVIGYVADDIEGGATLSEAMGKHPRCFNRLFVNMVAAGEMGGVLDVILERVAGFMEKSQRLKTKIKGALVYPVVVLIAAFLIVMGLMTFVIPVFADVLTDMADGRFQMPKLTQVLLDASTWLKGRHGLNAVMVGLAPFAVIAVCKLIRQFRQGRYVMDWIKLHVPLVRTLVYKTAVARWARTLATLINAGVPILDSLKITRETSENEVFADTLSQVQRAICQGDTFARPLGRSNTVDELVVNMIEVGEETGELDKMLMKIANNFDEETDVQISSLMSVLEPVMIILLGGVVGTIVLAIFLPIIEIFKNW
ncbi:MAG: type II secretion system F family protein [Planctomycetota bacterium]|jgi:type IV pilus assembly protein PilC